MIWIKLQIGGNNFLIKCSMQYEVTIGIPVYNAAGYIEKTLLSAINQTFESIEFLVVDDCSEDNSMDIVYLVKETHPRGGHIRIIQHKQNLGVGVTRNRILDESRGKFLFFLDSDDMIEPDAISLLYEHIKDCNADVVYGSLERIDLVGGGRSQYFQFPNECLLNGDEMAQYAFGHYKTFQISVCNCLFDLDFLRHFQLRFIEAAFWEDLAFTYDMVTKVKKAVLLSAVTYHYFCRPGSQSHYQDRELLYKEEIMNNISVINYLKGKCVGLKGKSYLPELCYNLEVNSFYIVNYILKFKQRILPPFSRQEMKNILCHPLSLYDIFVFKKKNVSNLAFFLLGKLPSCLGVLTVFFLGKLKRLL